MAQVNGEMPKSAFFSHIISYPVVSDSISTFQSHPIGKKSIDLTSSSYEKFGKPLLPYLSKPYETVTPYVIPYAKKADSFGDSTLSTVDSKFPYVKKPTGEIYSDAKSVVFFPLTKSLEGKDYVFKTYNTELKNVGGDSVITYGKAAVATSLIVASDSLSWLGSFLSKKKAQAKEVANEKMNN
jgi:hypothetical protein